MHNAHSPQNCPPTTIKFDSFGTHSIRTKWHNLPALLFTPPNQTNQNNQQFKCINQDSNMKKKIQFSPYILSLRFRWITIVSFFSHSLVLFTTQNFVNKLKKRKYFVRRSYLFSVKFFLNWNLSHFINF